MALKNVNLILSARVAKETPTQKQSLSEAPYQLDSIVIV